MSKVTRGKVVVEIGVRMSFVSGEDKTEVANEQSGVEMVVGL